MGRQDALDLVELAYQLDLPDAEWLAAIGRACGARVTGGMVPSAYLVSRSETGAIRIGSAFTEGVPNATDLLQAMADSIDPGATEVLFPFGTDCAFFTESLRALPEEQRDSAGAGALGMLAAMGGDDSFGIRCVDAAGCGILVGVLAKNGHVSQPARQIFLQLASHLGAGARLRRILRPEAVVDAAEAIFEPDGRLAHATGSATSATARSHLRDAVKNIDRARLRDVRRDESAALDLWQGLVTGQWSLIDRHDTDGRRYYVAIRNPPVAVRARALTAMEARVVALVVAGEPNKVIGYGLGIAESTVSGHVSSALRKLGASSRVELIHLARALALDPTGGEDASLEQAS